MPGGDGTGPGGMGSMTGRAAGYCAGYGMPGYANPVGGRGYWGRGMGRGFGRGFGRGMGFGARWGAAPYYGGAGYVGLPAYYGAPTSEQERDMLKSQAEGLQRTLEDIQKRITELGSDKK